eukprot:Phypoly_transcript_03158.p1 GENE.Phypoly_transcript_03158~~Phypoly_transcript_03158.p1  ORF type:complete len:848 (+),score=111.51 Phypoly_transcript_03158:212-2545(+)
MGLSHKIKPHWGVQFHPESICSSFGEQILINFKNLTQNVWSSRSLLPSTLVEEPPKLQSYSAECINYELEYKKIKMPKIDPTTLFCACNERFKHQNTDKISFWLDSSITPEQNRSRFSFFGFCDRESLISYDVFTKTVTHGSRSTILPKDQTFFSFLQNFLRTHVIEHDEKLPFSLQTGLVGYLGYEMGMETGMERAEKNNILCFGGLEENPSAAFVFAEKMVALDLIENEIYLVTACRKIEIDKLGENEEWRNTMSDFLQAPHDVPDITVEDENFHFFLAHDYSTYIEKIKACKQEIRNGESYELCLTNKLLSHQRPRDALKYFLNARSSSPVPYGAFFDFGSFQIVSCSPELFLEVDANKKAKSKPIKGTAPRDKSPEIDEKLRHALEHGKKEFSENLMIVDLIRNDFGRCCEVGSVEVPFLMKVESYATVHQLVTTVTGSLAPKYTCIDMMQSMFPPGSMTGAPKKRSVQILNELELSKRGIYSGCIGFFSLSGCCNFSVVIRTAVLNSSGMYVGIGGAIIYASDDQEEFDETILKSKAMLKPLKNSTIWGTSENPIWEKIPKIPPDFELLETLLYDHNGFSDLALHLDRMENSAKYFGFNNFGRTKLQHQIITKAKELEREHNIPLRVRVLHSENGTNSIQGTSLTPLHSPYRVQLAKRPVSSQNPFLRHKTTRRNVYQSILALQSEKVDDVILYNELGQITESTIANIAILIEGKLITPKTECGLLPGTYRRTLLEKKEIEEGIVTIDQLKNASEIILFNSVRGKFNCSLIN